MSTSPTGARVSPMSQHSPASASKRNSSILTTGKGKGDSGPVQDNGAFVQPPLHHDNHGAHEDGSPIAAQDFSQDIGRANTRRAGGFLLSSAFRRGSDGERAFSLRNKRPNSKGKSRVENGNATGKIHPSTTRGASAFNHTFPQERPLSGSWSVAVDGDDSLGPEESDVVRSGSHNSRRAGVEMGNNNPTVSQYASPKEHPQPAAIDPSQIVNMALNLSEGRRRNIGGSSLPQHQPASGRRVISSGVPVLHGNHTSAIGGSLRQHLQEQRRISRNIPSGPRNLPGARSTPSTYVPSHAMELSDGQNTIQYQFSSATLARAEKARQYIELSFEFRRLLQFLPVLVPRAKSQRSRSSDPSRPQTSDSTTAKSNETILGRRYNPLQSIRNRKARGRTRTQLDPDIHHWNDPEVVHHWIDAVADASQISGYCRGHQVALPVFSPEQHGRMASSVHDSDPAHTKQSGVASRPTRPRLDWFTSPSELLADAYWLEQEDSKSMIEDPHGGKLYPPVATVDSLHPRASVESSRSHQGSTNLSAGSQHVVESDPESRQDDRGRGQNVHQHIRNDSTGRFKIWHKGRGRSHSPSSDLSHSDDEAGSKLKKVMTERTAEENDVAPLERHMNKMILNMQTDPVNASPSLISPGTPNKWGLDQSGQYRSPRLNEEELSNRQASTRMDASHLAPVPNGSRVGKQPASSQNDGRLSLDGLDSTNPNSPVSTSFMPSIAVDLSPPPSRKHSPKPSSKKSKLPFARSDHGKEGRNGDFGAGLFEESDSRLSRLQSEELQYHPQSTDGVTSSVKQKALLSPKANESLSSLQARPASRGKDSKEIREPDSAVRRFFKGGRLGEIVRNEGAKVGGLIRKRESPHDEDVDMQLDSASTTMDESDTEDTLSTTNARGQRTSRSSKRKPIADSLKARKDRPHNQKAEKPLYHIDLPSFKPASSSPNASQPSTPGQDHISEQQRHLTNNRSSRLDRLLPPNLDISRVSTNTSMTSSLMQTQTYSTSPSHDNKHRRGLNFHRSASRASERLTAALNIPGRVENGSFPTALAALEKTRSASSSGYLDKRHWSIADNQSPQVPHPVTSMIGATDIARVRALLLDSGIKAAELSRQAQCPRRVPAAFLTQAAQSANALLVPVPRKEEHIVAARLLTSAIDNETLRLRRSGEQFRSATVVDLQNRLDDLRARVSDGVERARNAADEAVGFGALVTGGKTIELRRVVDAMEKFRRRRRRRMRWIRRVGFGLLEWGVLLFMWWVWLIVVIVRTVWTLLRGTFRVVKWVFWL